MKNMTTRIQRKRTKGWRAPANTVWVGRPGKWGNPFKVGSIKPDGTPMTAQEAVAAYALAFYSGELAVTPEMARKELRGKNVMCFCPVGSPCHADVLGMEANATKV